MENKIQIFKNSEFGEIRTVQINDEPWFVGKDVAEASGYNNTKDAIIKHIDKEDRSILQRSQNTTFENQNYQNGSFEIPCRGLIVINESGLYSLILSSKLPTAKKFKHWVTSEVLPSIRRHGAYMTSETIEKIEAYPDIVIHLATALKEERERHRMELQEEREKHQTALRQLQTEVNDERDYSFRTTLDFSKQADKTRQARKEALAFKKKAKDYLFIADGMKHLLKENNIRIPANLLLYREDYEFLNEKDPQLEAFTTGKKRKKTRKQS